MGRLKRGMGNKGISLLLVIVTMSFVAVIAAIVVAVTYRNLETMKNNLGSARNFYTAETAMDEMRTKFYEWSDEAFRKSYGKWLQQYGSAAEDEREKLFKTGYVKELEAVIDSNFMCYFGSAPEDIGNLFMNFTSDRVSWNEGFVPYIEKNDDETVMTVKDISLVYKDSSGYETAITADLKFDVKYDGLAHNALENSDADCAAYAIISDCRIGNSPSSNVRIDGNIYAGGYNRTNGAYGDAGILFDGGKLDIYADTIVSRGDIEFTNEARLNAKGPGAGSGLGGERCNIWAQGFGLTGVGAAAVDILGNCYVYDDTTLDAAKSSFTVDGSYYGYNTNNAAGHMTDADDIELRMGTPGGSSSIVINGKETKVDLTKCDPVWIAGKTFVSVPKLYGVADIDTNVPFPEGEAIAYRGTQSAYLLPGECVIGIGHNPMSQEEYERLINDEDVFIDIDKSRKNGGVALAGYVQIDRPYRAATVDYSPSDTTNKLVYLYLNFISTDKATEYFQEYSEKHNELVVSKMAVLGGGSISFDPETLVTTGNAVSYKEKSGKPDVSVTEGKYTVFDDKIEEKETELNNRFHGLITALDENFAGIGTNEFMTDNFVDFSKVDGSVQKKEQPLSYEPGSGNKYKLITGNNIEIKSNVHAIIISAGDVTISAGARVNGLILAKGDVKLTGASVYAEPDDVAELILNDETVAPYFSFDTADSTGAQGNGMYSSDLIGIDYVNWRKN